MEVGLQENIDVETIRVGVFLEKKLVEPLIFFLLQLLTTAIQYTKTFKYKSSLIT